MRWPSVVLAIPFFVKLLGWIKEKKIVGKEKVMSKIVRRIKQDIDMNKQLVRSTIGWVKNRKQSPPLSKTIGKGLRDWSEEVNTKEDKK